VLFLEEKRATSFLLRKGEGDTTSPRGEEKGPRIFVPYARKGGGGGNSPCPGSQRKAGRRKGASGGISPLTISYWGKRKKDGPVRPHPGKGQEKRKGNVGAGPVFIELEEKKGYSARLNKWVSLFFPTCPKEKKLQLSITQGGTEEERGKKKKKSWNVPFPT